MQIGNIDLDNEVLLIAEIGNNHEGDVSLAEKMIKEAAAAGVHAVKFQTIEPEQLVLKSDEARFEQLSRFALKRGDYEHLAKIADEESVMFLSTPFSIDAVEWLEPLMPAFKIASGDNDFDPLLECIAKKGKPVILSTGMSTLQIIEHACFVLNNVWERGDEAPGLALLHCVSAYPANPSDVNLATIKLLKKYCDEVGYSDHVLGIETAVLSVAAGARIVEKHFTIDKKYSDFRDHELSADVAEMSELADRIIETSKIFGQNEKYFLDSEKNISKNARRSIVASHKLTSGKIIELSDLKWLRPGDGISPVETNKLIGRTLKKDVVEGQKINLSLFK